MSIKEIVVKPLIIGYTAVSFFITMSKLIVYLIIKVFGKRIRIYLYVNLFLGEKMTYRLLLVEDDAELREIITDYFVEKSGGSFIVEYAETGIEAQEKYMEGEYDLVLLDVMLSEVDEFTICRELISKPF